MGFIFCRRIEEEARQKAALERKKMEEEARMLIEEEAKRSKLFEEERQMEFEKQKLHEEADKKKVNLLICNLDINNHINNQYNIGRVNESRFKFFGI